MPNTLQYCASHRSEPKSKYTPWHREKFFKCQHMDKIFYFPHMATLYKKSYILKNTRVFLSIQTKTNTRVTFSPLIWDFLLNYQDEVVCFNYHQCVYSVMFLDSSQNNILSEQLSPMMSRGTRERQCGIRITMGGCKVDIYNYQYEWNFFNPIYLIEQQLLSPLNPYLLWPHFTPSQTPSPLVWCMTV